MKWEFQSINQGQGRSLDSGFGKVDEFIRTASNALALARLHICCGLVAHCKG